MADGVGVPGLWRTSHDPRRIHGDLAAAVVDNVFLLLGLPLLAIWVLVRWRRGERLMPATAIATVIIAAVAWTIVRNWSGFPLVPTLLWG